jgi:pimeloyl-ACP methyl ester carboxylesterase
VHGEGGDRTAWTPLVPRLREAGFAVLAIDLRGHGESGSGPERSPSAAVRSPFESMDLDVWGAYDWVVQQPGIDRGRFALIGAELGASVALRYAALDRSVDAVICLSPGAVCHGLDARADLERIRGRRLLMLTTADDEAAVRELSKPVRGAKVKRCDGQGRGTQLLEAGRYADREIVEFLGDAIGKPGKSVVYGSVQKDVYHLPGSGWIEKISPSNLRHYSSREEAESRGLRAARSTGPEDVPRRRRP